MKTCRIELRSSEEEREKFLEAATLLNIDNLSDFIRKAAHLLAQKTFEEQERLVLSDKDRDMVLELLAHPPKPSKRLKETYRRYLQTDVQ